MMRVPPQPGKVPAHGKFRLLPMPHQLEDELKEK